ncbi:MAG TPA: sigma-70 family RNA polymerase sigma factor [Candidatus Kryptonia bacterium]|nr:sigma-70 family RNA polymerase sigma factor [Candidatus Kryptonia bacterium]
MRGRSKTCDGRFDEEVLPHLTALYNFASALAGADEAEDLVQVTCVRALEHFDSYRPGTNVRAWLFTILRNESVSRHRREQRRALLEPGVPVDVIEEVYDDAADLETLLINQRWSAEIKAALLDLPENYRLPVYLKDVEGFGYREIAEVVGCPMGTVMSRLARGRAALRATLTQQARERGLVSTDGATDDSHDL